MTYKKKRILAVYKILRISPWSAILAGRNLQEKATTSRNFIPVRLGWERKEPNKISTACSRMISFLPQKLIGNSFLECIGCRVVRNIHHHSIFSTAKGSERPLCRSEVTLYFITWYSFQAVQLRKWKAGEETEGRATGYTHTHNMDISSQSLLLF